MKVGLIYDPIYLEHDTGWHVENRHRKNIDPDSPNCKYPTEVCFHFGTLGRYTLENNLGREITRQEAHKILRQCAEVGLVHGVSNYQERVDTLHGWLTVLERHFFRVLDVSFCTALEAIGIHSLSPRLFTLIQKIPDRGRLCQLNILENCYQKASSQWRPLARVRLRLRVIHSEDGFHSNELSGN